MNRIRKTFERLRSEHVKALIPYITPEFPFKGITVPLLRELENAGADLIEVGIPFSDPLADGATIQHSSEVALKNGVNIPMILSSVKEFRRTSSLAVLLMGYINPILSFGTKEFLKECASVGVDGLIVPDLPPEEAGELREESSKNNVGNVFLIAPTTTDERIKKIDEVSTDFTYCVSVTGVTGARNELSINGSLDHFLQRVRKIVKKPYVVGFGISNSDQVKKIWQHADGAVVGSALVQAVSKAADKRDALQKAGEFFRSLKQ